MTIKNPKQLFVLLLTNVRQGTERTSQIFRELSKVAENPHVKEAMEARVLVSKQILEKLNECFKLIAQNATGSHRKIWRSGTRLLLVGLAVSEGVSETEIGLYKVLY